MNTITGVIRNGRIEIDLPAEWPDGQTVEVTLADEEPEQMTEEKWPTTPEGIEAWFKGLCRLGPLFQTPEEEAAFHSAIEQHGNWELESPHEAPRFD